MSWWLSADNLSQRQLRIIENAVDRVGNTPSGACLWVQGCAGVGKTLVLAHIAKRLQASKQDFSVIFLSYTHALKAMIEKTISQSGVVGADVATYKSFLSASRRQRYDVIVLDELQDVKLAHLEALKSRCTHLVAAGDCEQRIFENSNAENAIDQKITFKKGRLFEIFRITPSVVKCAQKIMPWTKLTEAHTSKNKQDVTIAVRQFDDCAREAKWIYTEAEAFARPGYPSAILLPHHNAIQTFCQSLVSVLDIRDSGPEVRVESERISDYRELNKYFEFHGRPLRYLGNGIGNIDESDGRPLVFIMTYHSAKGLDFHNVFLPLLHSGQYIYKTDEAARILFFVAITRTRERLVLSFTGKAPHALIEDMPKDVVAFVKDDPKRDIDEEEDLF